MKANRRASKNDDYVNRHVIMLTRKDGRGGKINLPIWLSEAKYNKTLSKSGGGMKAFKLNKEEWANTVDLIDRALSENKAAGMSKERRGGWVAALLPFVAALAPVVIEAATKYGPKVVTAVKDKIEKWKGKGVAATVQITPRRSCGSYAGIDIPTFDMLLKKSAGKRGATLTGTRNALKKSMMEVDSED